MLQKLLGNISIYGQAVTKTGYVLVACCIWQCYWPHKYENKNIYAGLTNVVCEILKPDYHG